MTRLEKFKLHLLAEWWYIKDSIAQLRRILWNRFIVLNWEKLWVRKDEFHKSLNINVEAVLGMNKKQQEKYYADLDRRRRIAHERDFEDWKKFDE